MDDRLYWGLLILAGLLMGIPALCGLWWVLSRWSLTSPLVSSAKRLRITLKPMTPANVPVNAADVTPVCSPILHSTVTAGDRHLANAYRAMVHDDIEQPLRFVKITKGKIDWSKASLPHGAYLTFSCTAYQASLHQLNFRQQPSGGFARYLADGKDGEIALAPKLDLIGEGMEPLLRGKTGEFTIRQHLTPEVQTSLLGHRNMEVSFDFGDVHMPVRAAAVNAQGRLDPELVWNVPLPKWEKVKVPDTLL